MGRSENISKYYVCILLYTCSSFCFAFSHFCQQFSYEQNCFASGKWTVYEPLTRDSNSLLQSNRPLLALNILCIRLFVLVWHGKGADKQFCFVSLCTFLFEHVLQQTGFLYKMSCICVSKFESCSRRTKSLYLNSNEAFK